MQLLVRTQSSSASINAATDSPVRLPYSKAYQRQAHMLWELSLKHDKHKRFPEALDIKKGQLHTVVSADSADLSVRLLGRQVQSLESQTKQCEDCIATLRHQLELNMLPHDELDAEEQAEISSAVLSATSDVYDFNSEWRFSSRVAPVKEFNAALDQALTEELEQVSIDGPVEEVKQDVVSFVPVNGWENVLGTWV